MSTCTSDKLDDANNVLLLGSFRDEGTHEACGDPIAVRETTQLNVLNVVIDHPPTERLGFRRTHVDEDTLQLHKPLFDAVVEVDSENAQRGERFDSVEPYDHGGATRFFG